jgi:hypothetical protein
MTGKASVAEINEGMALSINTPINFESTHWSLTSGDAGMCWWVAGWVSTSMLDHGFRGQALSHRACTGAAENPQPPAAEIVTLATGRACKLTDRSALLKFFLTRKISQNKIQLKFRLPGSGKLCYF